MSTQNLLPDPQAAYDHLFQGVHQKVFFQKLASAGYVVESPQQAGYLLNLAGKLRLVQEEQATKTAADRDPYAAALAHLDGALSAGGYGSVKAAAEADQEWAIKSAASDLMEDPDMYNSVLSLKQAQADWAAQQQAPAA